MRGRGLRHAPPHRGRASEQQMIKLQARELCGHADIALNHGEFLGGEIALHQFGQLGRGLRRQLAGFEHHAVARCQRRNRRAQRQLHGVIPGCNDADHAQRLALNPATPRHQQHGGPDALALGPALQLAQAVFEQLTQQHQLHHLRQLRRANTKIRLYCCGQLTAIGVEHFLQAQQALTTHHQRHLNLHATGLVLQVKNAMQIHVLHAYLKKPQILAGHRACRVPAWIGAPCFSLNRNSANMYQ